MTPAERASAVAFALKNCALEAMTPNDATIRAANDYEHGDKDVRHVVETANQSPHDPASGIFARTVLLIEHGWDPTGDLDELIAIHRGIFDGVYKDAGQLRTANVKDHESPAYIIHVNKGEEDMRLSVQRGPGEDEASDETKLDDDPEAFFPAHLIETGAMNISTELSEKRNLRNLDRDVFTHALAKIYDELGYLHPFKGGNATVLRIFASRLAHDAGWDLDWGSVTREAYKASKDEAYNGDIRGFERLLMQIQRPANPTRIFLISGWNQGPAH